MWAALNSTHSETQYDFVCNRFIALCDLVLECILSHPAFSVQLFRISKASLHPYLFLLHYSIPISHTSDSPLCPGTVGINDFRRVASRVEFPRHLVWRLPPPPSVGPCPIHFSLVPPNLVNFQFLFCLQLTRFHVIYAKLSNFKAPWHSLVMLFQMTIDPSGIVPHQLILKSCT